MRAALFIRLLSYEDKDAALVKAVNAIKERRPLNQVVYTVDPSSFQQVPGTPFTYWVSEHIRHLFTELPSFESEGLKVKQGLVTADDFRFLRAWWEVSPKEIVSGTANADPDTFRHQTFMGKSYVPVLKGGEFSPFYADIYLVVKWKEDGREIRTFSDPKTGYIYSRYRGADLYFFPGLTWPARPHRRGAFSHVPSGAIFSHTGTMLFLPLELHWVMCAILNSDAYIGLLHMLMPRGGAEGGQTLKYEIGYVASVPIPEREQDAAERLGKLASNSYHLTRSLNTVNEVSHFSHLPALLQTSGDMLKERIAAWQASVTEAEQQLAANQREINDIAFRLYGISDEDRRAIESSVTRQASPDADGEQSETDDEAEDEQISTDQRQLTADFISYAVGCAFGRWDARFATGERPAPELPDPFAPLPVCAPGALTGEDGLPLNEAPEGYPLRVDSDGILVDDAAHTEDIVACVREVFELIWPQAAEAREREACELLGVKELRDYFRKPGAGGFWMDHVRRYSKSRRKAPIYWLLQSSKKNYALWLYYHRLDKDILFKALLNYVEPKLRLEENNLDQLRHQREAVGTAGREAKQVEKQLEKQESLLSELHDFHDKLKRAADLHLEPDLNDGVVLNIAPLWELVPWAEAKKYWNELSQGKYQWASISKQLREQGKVAG